MNPDNKYYNVSVGEGIDLLKEDIKDIAKSISVIPDRLLRSEYCKLSSRLLDISESDLMNEVSHYLHEKKSFSVKSPISSIEK